MMETKTYTQMSYLDLDELVSSTYGRSEYEYIADIECGNDSDQSYEEVFKKPLDEYQFKDLEKFINTGQYNYITYTLIQDLVNKGLLPEGNILIQVSW